MSFSRRNFLRIGGAGIIASQVPSVFARTGREASSEDAPGIPFELGIASYTFRKFSLEETIRMTGRLAILNLCLKDMHLPLDLPEPEIREEAARVASAGIRLYGCGVVYMKSNEQVDRAFSYAQAAGMKVIIAAPEHELLAYCNEKVKSTGIRMAIHNHGPGDERYPTPEGAFDLIRDMDPGMGLCVDIGHIVRLGGDPILQTSDLMERVLDIHFKDVDKAEESGYTCEAGRGVIDLPRFLRMLIKKKYSHVVSFEFEKDENDPLPGVAESVGYVRGVLKMLG
jgi:inosose dehydratase